MKAVVASRKAMAYHEAGHAVVAWHLGLKPSAADIVRVGPQGGQVVWEPHQVNLALDTPEASLVERDICERHIMTLQAGGLAQRRALPRSSLWPATRSDDMQIVRRLAKIHRDTKVLLCHRHYLEARAEFMVRKHWSSIEQVAKDLLEYERLDARHLLDLLSE